MNRRNMFGKGTELSKLTEDREYIFHRALCPHSCRIARLVRHVCHY